MFIRAFRHIRKSSSAARCTRLWLGNKHMSMRSFCHITKSSSAARCTRRRLDNTSSCPYVRVLIVTLLYIETHIWTCACVTKSASSASCSWWRLCYVSKSTCGHVLLLPSRCLVRLEAHDDFVMCRSLCMNMCLCYQVNVYCVLQPMMTLFECGWPFCGVGF